MPNAAWGSQQGAIFIAASQFSAKLNPADPDLDYFANHFYTGSGRYFAQITLEPGNRFDSIACQALDVHADNVGFLWQRVIVDTINQNSTFTTMDSSTTSGSPGLANVILVPPAGQETMRIYQVPNIFTLHYLAVDLTPNVAFSGCLVFYYRQVAPAPTTATYTDVPVGHPFHRFVEALVSTGVTAGCGGGLYCVNAPITRGEMAVFLAVALGMGFPH
jgi:hypothetical protein